MRGALLCLVSASGFATLGIFGTLASEAGASITSTLLVRFGLAAVAFLLLVRITGGWAGLRRLPRRVVLTGLGLGAIGYSLQSGLYFLAIDRLDVALVSLLLYTYPAFVTVAALVLGRAKPTARTWLALGVASVGLVLVLAAAGAASFDVLGAGLALAASLTYTTYILVSDGIVSEVEPFTLSALVLTGGTVSFSVAGAATGTLDLGLSGEAWLWLALIALVSTVVAVSAFFAGLRRVGPSEAAILSTFEPPVTVALAFLVLGERLTVPQLAGGALVLAAVIALQLPSRVSRRRAWRLSAPSSARP
ncbi:MAG TPA: DMT family transporter [Solirubrobacteraceae bacterium]|jgi:drug/metabolite transporter (DMT)-like permease|nr:DMT family transporter [Solirubrobacteraceae bacterium]